MKWLWDIYWNRLTFWPKVIVGGLLVIFVLVAFGLIFNSCGDEPAPLNEAEIQQGEAAKKANNDKVLREILVNADVREKEIDAKVANAEANTVNAYQEARSKWANANRDELQAEFDRRAKGQ